MLFNEFPLDLLVNILIRDEIYAILGREILSLLSQYVLLNCISLFFNKSTTCKEEQKKANKR